MASNTISFRLNGEQHVVPLSEKRGITTSLNDYIRTEAGLTGTKVMCREAGCGCCAVAVTMDNPLNGGKTTHSINSCICPLLSVDGWQITTVEGLGSEKEGYHPIQKRIADFNGTQCGYCTPGMVMNMYGLLHENSRPTEREVEDNFDGNICRCTGYRPILDAMKSFATDTGIKGAALIDIEDLNKKLCPRTREACKDENSVSKCSPCVKPDTAQLHLQSAGSHWYRPVSLKELGDVMRSCEKSSVNLVFGNTSSGIFKNKGPFDVHIDLRAVKELYETEQTDSYVKFGGNTSLTKLIKTLRNLQNKKPGFNYLGAFVKHLKLVGNVLMRNAACVAGNLMIKHSHPDFPSDVFTLTEAVGGIVEIYDSKDDKTSSYSVLDFVKKVNMERKVLKSIKLPALDTKEHFRSYKITPRSQNAHAYVNAAFKFRVSSEHQTLDIASIVIGGISDTFFHAEKTEHFLKNKEIKNENIKEALAILHSEVNPSPDPVLALPEYRRDLAVNLLYKTLLGIKIPSKATLASGGFDIERPISSGVQTWKDIKEEWPLKQPLPKKTALLQASGEAEYVNDMPKFQKELCGALVLSTNANATIKSIDPAPALAILGVERFISASDIPEGGINENYANYRFFPLPKEELFSTGRVEFAGQVIGMILAETQVLADKAAEKVVVKYKDIKKPILTIDEAIEAQSFHPGIFGGTTTGSPDEAFAQSARQIEGEIRMGQQYAFYMETICCLSVPTEEGLETYVTFQSSDLIQTAIAGVLNKPLNYVNIHIPRLGGGFGGKSFSSNLGVATALAAYVTGRPVRSSNSLSITLKNTGKRPMVLAKYKAGFTEEGKLNAIILDIYIESGMSGLAAAFATEYTTQMDQGYSCPNWRINPIIIKTNRPPASTVRAPGAAPASAIIETILEHMAKVVNSHPILVKELNLVEKDQKDVNGTVLAYCTMREVWNKLKTTAQVAERMKQIDVYNQANQWRKRGITMSAIKFGMTVVLDHGMPLLLSVYSNDGTVTVVQGGVEMGQGLYTKVAQAVAYGLGIPIDMVKVRRNLSYIVPNSSFTGGSTTSERAVRAALEACKALNEKLEPVKAKLPPGTEWKDLVDEALKAKVDLSAKAMPFTQGQLPHYYFTYCAAVVETELDVLTGQYAINRTDIMFDCGESLNPMIDIGQIEGAFVFGLGLSLLEDMIYDMDTGTVLNDGTWEYKPPTTKDIPIDWRVHLLPDAPNPVGIRSSKATGEPATGLAAAALLSLKRSAEMAQQDLTGTSSFLPVVIPFTVDKIQQSVGIQLDHLKL